MIPRRERERALQSGSFDAGPFIVLLAMYTYLQSSVDN